MTRSARLGWLMFALRAALPCVLLAALWWPEWTHFSIDRGDYRGPWPPPAQAGAVLGEIASMDLAEIDSVAVTPQGAWDAVRAGRIEIPGLTNTSVPLVGQPQDINVGPPSYQLFVAGLSLERLLLEHAARSGDAAAADAAIQRVLALAEAERRAGHDRGFLWNDHAVAARVSVLAGVWSWMRERPERVQAGAGQAVLGFVERTGRMLAKPSQFTVATNHGVMQNIALLQLSAAFPWLPEAPSWRALGAERLDLQLRFYVSTEGAVLEHSPGYQAMGVNLLALSQRVRRLNGLPGDARLDAAVARSAHVLDVLLRPDGTLPAVGNTDGHSPVPFVLDAVDNGGAAPRRSAAAGRSDPVPETLLPVSGWGVWWMGPAEEARARAQLMFTWAHHPGHGHKHADELSFTWWSHGEDWLTSAGYWPYGHPWMKASYDWPASNAPHAESDLFGTARRSELLGIGAAGGVRAVALRRASTNGARFERQIVALDPDTIVVLDFHEASNAGARTVWTFGPKVVFGPDGDSGWRSEPIDGRRLSVALAAAGPQRTLMTRGSPAGGIGWIVGKRRFQSVAALQVETAAATGARATLFALRPQDAQALSVRLAAGAQPQNWDVEVSGMTAGSLRVWRRDQALSVHVHADAAPLRVQLAPPSVGAEAYTAELRSALRDALHRYPKWRDLWRYRVRAAVAVGALFVLLEALWWLGARRSGAAPAGRIALLATSLTLVWALAAYGIIGIYLR